MLHLTSTVFVEFAGEVGFKMFRVQKKRGERSKQLRRAVQFLFDALPQGGADAAEGRADPRLALTEGSGDLPG